jgi:hypothetical protein
MGVTGDRAPAECEDGAFMGERFVGAVTESEERLRDSEVEEPFKWLIASPDGCCCCC